MTKKEFTASVYILSEKGVLLIYHRKLQKWLPPGGHLDPQELPAEAAVREAREETGLAIEIFSDEHVWIERWNANSQPRPYLCLLEEIPAYRDHPAHQHVDFIYLAKPTGGCETFNENETGGLRWFQLEEIETLQGDIEIFEETRIVIRSIFHSKGELCVKKPFSLPLQDKMLERQLSV